MAGYGVFVEDMEILEESRGRSCDTVVLGWLSPRISFSYDFAQLERAPPTKKESPRQECCPDFEFCMSVLNSSDCLADEIFSDGKIVPLELIQGKNMAIVEEEEEMVDAETSVSVSDEEEARKNMKSAVCGMKSASFPTSRCDYPSPERMPTCSGTWKDLFGFGRPKGRGSKAAKQTPKIMRMFWGSFGSEKEKDTFRLSDSCPKTNQHSTQKFQGSAGHSPEKCQVISGFDYQNQAIGHSSVPVDLEENCGAKSTSCSRAGSPRRANTRSASFGYGTYGKPNHGIIVMKNLERCSKSLVKSSERMKREGWIRSSETRIGSSYSSNVRVAPLLNVPMCITPAIKVSDKDHRGASGMVRFIRILFHRAHKVPPKPNLSI